MLWFHFRKLTSWQASLQAQMSGLKRSAETELGGLLEVLEEDFLLSFASCFLLDICQTEAKPPSI